MTEEEILSNKSRFKHLVCGNIHRKGIDELMEWLETTDFYTAPSSTRYHGAEPGGLCKHSLFVYDQLKRLSEDESEETLAIVALFHDLCKVNTYKESTRNVKLDSGKWVRVPCYEVDEMSAPLGHGEKSMYLLMKYIDLSEEEALTIRWHMGAFAVESVYEKPALSRALGKYRLVLKLQMADCASSFWYNA